MQDEDLEAGTTDLDSTIDPVETPTEAPEEGSQETPEIVHDTTQINPVSDALKTFEQELGGAPVQPGQPQPPKLSRKYDGLDPDEIPIFKHMHNQAYNAFYPKYLESKKLKQEHEQLRQQFEEASKMHFYEQEGAWKLAPEYNDLSSHQDQISREVSYWEQQLESIKAGETWRPLHVNAEGQLYQGNPVEATPQAEAMVMSKISKGHSIINDVSNRLAQFEEGFKGKHQTFVAKLKDIEAQVVGKENLEKVSKLSEKKLAMFPRMLQGRPEVQMLAKLMVINEGLIAMLRSQKGANTSNIIKQTTSRNSSVPKPAGSGADKPGTVGDIVNQFERAKQGLI